MYVYNHVQFIDYDNLKGKREHTIEPTPVSPIFFNYYNPHRNPDTKSYFNRCFTRMNEVMKDDSIDKVYVLADYTNKDRQFPA